MQSYTKKRPSDKDQEGGKVCEPAVRRAGGAAFLRIGRKAFRKKDAAGIKKGIAEKARRLTKKRRKT